MTIKSKQTGQAIVEFLSLSESKVKIENEDIIPNDEDSNVDLDDTEKSLDKLDIDKVILSMEEEYTEDEKPFVREAVIELINEGIKLDAPNFYLLAARKIIFKQKQLLNEAKLERENLLQRLELIPENKRINRKELTLQSFIQESVVNSNSAFEYLTVCGAVYLYCMQDKLDILGLEIKEGFAIADKISTMNKTLNNDTKNALAATIRAFSGIRTGNVIQGISTRTHRKEDAKTYHPRWLIDEAVEDIVNATNPTIVETAEQVKLPKNSVG